MRPRWAKAMGLVAVRQKSAACYWLRILCQFGSEQPQQHLISCLVARRISFGNGNQLAIPQDIFIMDEGLHCALRPLCRSALVALCVVSDTTQGELSDQPQQYEAASLSHWMSHFRSVTVP